MSAHTQMVPSSGSLLRRWFQEVWNEGKESTIEELFPANSVMWGVTRPDVSSQGPEEFREFHQKMRSAFLDIHIALEDVVEQDDMAYTRFTVTAKHEGKDLKLVGMCALRASGGVIVEGWNVWDQIGLARELGMLGPQALTMFP
jgi:predicted ester cyclase